MRALAAAAKGALCAGLAAGLVLALLAFARGLPGDAFLQAFGALVFDELASSAGLSEVLLLPVLLSGVAGAVLGLLAARHRASPGRRVARLLLLGLPAFWAVCLGTALLLLSRPGVAPALDRAAVLDAALAGLVGLAAALPLGLGPAVGAVLILEGWTRPPEGPRTGLAEPRRRRLALGTLLLVAGGLALAAALRWPGPPRA